MKRDVAVLGIVRTGERAPADWQRRAIFAAQLLVVTGFTVEAAFLSAWGALIVVALGAVLLGGTQALFAWHKARQAHDGHIVCGELHRRKRPYER